MPTRVFAIANFKGGVGKTTVTLNLGACWAEQGLGVLLVDLDPSGNLTETLLSAPIDDATTPSIYDLLRPEDRVPLAAVIRPVALRHVRMDLAPAGRRLASVRYFIRDDPDWGHALARALATATQYDAIVIDCPPETAGVFTTLALGAATDALVVLQPEGGALSGTSEMNRHVEGMRRVNPALARRRMVVNMLDGRTALGRMMVEELRGRFEANLCATVVPRTVRLAEAMIEGVPAIEYDSGGQAADAFRRLATELWRID
jgi:chromosome partitioning protein